MRQTHLEDYQSSYPNIKLERTDDGILLVTFHTDGGPIDWSIDELSQTSYMFADIGRDVDNKVIILTGAGDTYMAKEHNPEFDGDLFMIGATDLKWLLLNLLEIEQPMIAAINGPATVHAELPLLCDIVLASDTACFRDDPHFFMNGMVPGDGNAIVWVLLMGPNRARYFLLTGQEISVQEAKDLGLVAEVLPRAELLPRAYELARILNARPPFAVRWSRSTILHHTKQEIYAQLGDKHQAFGLTRDLMADKLPFKATAPSAWTVKSAVGGE